MGSVIQIENLSKKYIIGHQQTERYLTFRDALASKLRTAGEAPDSSFPIVFRSAHDGYGANRRIVGLKRHFPEN